MILRGPFQPGLLCDSVISWLYLFSLEIAFNIHFEECENKISCPSMGVTWSLGSPAASCCLVSRLRHLLITHLLGWLA